MDDLIAETRKMNQLLLLAFGSAISERIDALLKTPANRVVLERLSGGEVVPTDTLLEAGKGAGMARTSMFEALSDLERAGVIERPRRGFVVVAAAAAMFLAGRP